MQLDPFDPNQINSGFPFIVVVGGVDATRTAVVTDIIRKRTYASIGTYVAGTEECALALKTVVPLECIHRKYSDDLIKTMYSRQKQVLALPETKEGKPVNKDCTLLLHECLPDTSDDQKTIKWAIMNGRCWRMTIIMSMASMQLNSPMIQPNIGYVYILPEPDRDKRALLYESAKVFPTFDAFCEALDKATQDGGCLVIDTKKDNVYIRALR